MLWKRVFFNCAGNSHIQEIPVVLYVLEYAKFNISLNILSINGCMAQGIYQGMLYLYTGTTHYKI